MDYYITLSMAQKIELLTAIQEAMQTGQITRVKTSRDSETDFNPNLDNSLMYQRLCDSIVDDDNFDPDNPIQAKCLKNQRPAITRPNFGGSIGGFCP